MYITSQGIQKPLQAHTHTSSVNSFRIEMLPQKHIPKISFRFSVCKLTPLHQQQHQLCMHTSMSPYSPAGLPQVGMPHASSICKITSTTSSHTAAAPAANQHPCSDYNMPCKIGNNYRFSRSFFPFFFLWVTNA